MLSLKIDGRWEPQDFIEILRAVESFYYKLEQSRRHRIGFPFFWAGERAGFISFESSLDHVNERLVAVARYETPSPRRLSVARIQYASPGGIDLLGIGKVFETLTNSIGRMKTYFDEAHLRSERDAQASLDTERKRVEVEKERQSLLGLKIQNAQEALKLIDSNPDVRDVLVPLLVRDQDAVASMLAERKLISAKLVPGARDQD